MESSPAIGSDGTIYVGSRDDMFYAINPNGTLKWSYTTGHIVVSSPAIGSDGTVYVGSYDDKLYAFGESTASVLSAPQNMYAFGGDGYVSVSWSAPDTNGVPDITNYKIYRGTTSGGETLLTTLGNVLTYNDTSVTNGQTYYYKVTAVNNIGGGTFSTEVQATPSVAGGDGTGDDDSSNLLMILATAIIVAAIAGGVAYALLRKPKTPIPPQQYEQSPPQQPPTQPPPSNP